MNYELKLLVAIMTVVNSIFIFLLPWAYFGIGAATGLIVLFAIILLCLPFMVLL